jgi:hypothetical protein
MADITVTEPIAGHTGQRRAGFREERDAAEKAGVRGSVSRKSYRWM